jgi:hypothetical protein
MVQIKITIDGSKLQFNLLSREDATPEEYEVAKHMQDLHLSIIQSAGVPVKITEVEDKRHLVPHAGNAILGADTPNGKVNSNGRKSGNV